MGFQFGVQDCSDQRLGLKWSYKSDLPFIEVKSMKDLPAKVWREIGQLVIDRESLTEGEEPRFAL